MSRTVHYINYLFNYELWSLVVIMFGYKQVEILLENVAEILVVLLICKVFIIGFAKLNLT